MLAFCVNNNGSCSRGGSDVVEFRGLSFSDRYLTDQDLITRVLVLENTTCTHDPDEMAYFSIMIME